jgi:hypothetical protein
MTGKALRLKQVAEKVDYAKGFRFNPTNEETV